MIKKADERFDAHLDRLKIKESETAFKTVLSAWLSEEAAV